MTRQINVSVIIPVYNVEQYILQCLESVINQTLENIEIIIVNDGTQDLSIEKIEHFLKENKTEKIIKFINKENGGLSSARNEGLKYCSGEYVSFIDSDDYIYPNFLAQLYEEAINYDLDIACGSYKKYFEEGDLFIDRIRKQELYDLGIVEGKKAFEKQIFIDDYRMEVWDDLYRVKFLRENNIQFYEGLIHEDEEFTIKALLSANKVKFIPTTDYIYRQRKNSIMSSKLNVKKLDSMIIIVEEWLKIYKNLNDFKTKYALALKIIYMTNNYISLIRENKDFNFSNYAKKIPIKDLNVMFREQRVNLGIKGFIKQNLLNINVRLYSLFL